MLTNATTTGAGSASQIRYANRITFQGYGTTTAGAGAATIKIQVSNNGTDWLDLGTISLTLSTTSSSDGFAAEAPWQYARANVTALSGTGASVSVKLSTN